MRGYSPRFVPLVNWIQRPQLARVLGCSGRYVLCGRRRRRTRRGDKKILYWNRRTRWTEGSLWSSSSTGTGEAGKGTFYIKGYFQNMSQPFICAHCVFQDPKVLKDYLKSYFDQFGDKACCFEDLKPYIVLDDEIIAEWNSYLRQTPIATVKQLVYCRLSQTQLVAA